MLQIDETEAEIVEEMCININCIPEDDFDNVVLAMYLNIIEYIDDDKQDGLIEMINLTENFNGVIAEIKEEGKKECMEKGSGDFIKELLRNHSIDEVFEFTGISKSF